MHLSIIIPAYNEEERITDTLIDVHRYLSGKSFDYEIIVVNDGSEDKTKEIVAGLQAKIKNLKIIDYGRNQGKGYAVRQGLLQATGDYRLFADADNSTNIAELEKFMPYANKNCIVIGSRSIEGSKIVIAQPKYRIFLGNIFNLFVKLIVGVYGLSDTQCGFKLLSADAVKSIIPKCTVNGWAFDVEILAIAKKMGCKIKEIPINWTNHKYSKVKLKGMLTALVDLFKISRRWMFFLIIILAILTRFAFLGYPSEIVFDEVYYLKSVTAYLNGEYYFIGHPPLATIIIAGFGKIIGFNPANLYINESAQIGAALDSKNILILRLLPAIAGVLFIILIYKTIIALGIDEKMAFLAGLLITLDGSFLILSRFVLPDIFLLLFGFTSFYFLILYSRNEKLILLGLSAVFSGLALSVKWTGLSFAGIILFYLLYSLIKNRNIFVFLAKLTFFISIFILVYFTVFSTSFEKFYEINKNIYTYHSQLTAPHNYASSWYQWPFMKKPIWYWAKDNANIYLTGNPVLWIFVLFFLPLSIITSFKQRFPVPDFLLATAYLINIIPFMLITRVVFLYHYMPALTFGLMGGVIYYARYLNLKEYLPLYYLILFLSVVYFIVLAPIYYGV